MLPVTGSAGLVCNSLAKKNKVNKKISTKGMTFTSASYFLFGANWKMLPCQHTKLRWCAWQIYIYQHVGGLTFAFSILHIL